MKSQHLTATLAVLLGLWGTQSIAAGPNDFFGGSVPGAVQDAAANAPSAAGDFTDDEKRMQKKYNFSVRHAKDLISKGEGMMKRAEERHDNKSFKKGKILKEIGQKQLAELEANNPFPDLKAKPKKADGGS
jgi:hypothetical protein